MYTLEIDCEETKHETLESVAEAIFDSNLMRFDMEYPFESVRGEYDIEGATTLDKIKVESLVIELIEEMQEETRQWNEHIKMESK